MTAPTLRLDNLKDVQTFLATNSLSYLQPRFPKLSESYLKMISFRTGLFRSQPLNALTRQTVRVPHAVTRELPYVFSSTFKSFSKTPEALKGTSVRDPVVVESQNQESRLWVAELIARARARDALEALTEMSDRELRKMVEDNEEDNEDNTDYYDYEDEPGLRSMLKGIQEEREVTEAEWVMYNAGKEYDAQMARKKSQSNLTKAETAKHIGGSWTTTRT